jgi:phosphoribosyl 1,2-cyclic phosphodiesterase
MNITIWGCRGSLPSPGVEKNEFGGNTSCVQVMHEDTCLILDGGSGIQRLGTGLSSSITQLDILLTHLHLDHIMGLGFFQPFYNPNMTVNIWGPSGSGESLEHRLRRYFSPPIFPVRLKELPCKLNIYEINHSFLNIGPFKVFSDYVCHPGPTVGYRVECGKAVLAYIPDHEPALGSTNFPNEPDWTSGYTIAQGADLLLHDAQYKNDEYQYRVGWGHSSMKDALDFAEMAKVKKMLFFHHDPLHTDVQLKHLFAESIKGRHLSFEAGICAEDSFFQLGY